MNCEHGTKIESCEKCAIKESLSYCEHGTKIESCIMCTIKESLAESGKGEGKEYNIVKIKGDGFCGLYAIMFSYLCHKNEFLKSEGEGEIDNMEKFIVYLDNYININIIDKKKFPDEVFTLLEQIKDKNTGTIKSDVLWGILSNIFKVNINIYIDDNTPGNIPKVIHRFIYNPKLTDIKIHGNLNHYSSIIDSNITTENIPSKAKKWLGNMLKINYTGRNPEEHEEFEKSYKFIEKKGIELNQYKLQLTTTPDIDDDKYEFNTNVDGSKRKSIKRKSIKRKSIKRKSNKRKSNKRKSIKRKSIKRKSNKRL